MQPSTPFLILAGLVAVSKPGLCYAVKRYTGVVTFTDFSRQSNTVCGPKSGRKGTYGAAAGDISPGISGGKSSGSIDLTLCRGQSPVNSYVPPRCPRGRCGVCYKVTNRGGHKGSHIGGIGKSIIARIIDNCPSVNARNFCKTKTSLDERCGSRDTNQLDIDRKTYRALTGQGYGFNSPNLDIDSACGMPDLILHGDQDISSCKKATL